MKKTALLVAFSLALVSCATLTSSRVQIEFRPAQDEPAPGWTDMKVGPNKTRVYVHDRVLLSNRDVESASAQEGGVGYSVLIRLTEAGAEKMARASEEFLDRRIAIFIDGKIVVAPIIRDRIQGRNAMLSGNYTRAEAERIASGISPR